MPPQKNKRWELASLFLKLGLTAFGGPAAHIAMMEDEVVRRRKWLSQEEFLDLVGGVNLIPGPNSTELAIHIGMRRAGWWGWLLAGTCFILPAALLCTALAWGYLRYGTLPQVQNAFYGIKPVIIGIIGVALWRLGKTAVKSGYLAAIGLAAITLNFIGLHELLVLFLAGILAVGIGGRQNSGGKPADNSASPDKASKIPLAGLGILGLGMGSSGLGAAAAGASLGKLFLFFLKVGSVLFGSGYVLLAFLQADLVDRWGWLSQSQLMDAIAVGQLTPGPVFTTATFIGYLLGGPAGAAVSTVGIFLPAFIFVGLTSRLLKRMRESRLLGFFLNGLNVGSLALMSVVTWELGRGSIVDVWTALMAVISGVLLARWRVNSAWLVLAGALVGLAVHLLTP